MANRRNNAAVNTPPAQDAVLTSEQRGDRADAREMGVDYVDMENYKRTFNKFDTDRSLATQPGAGSLSRATR